MSDFIFKYMKVLFSILHIDFQHYRRNNLIFDMSVFWFILQMAPVIVHLLLLMVFLGAFECSYVYFTRECDHWQISHGIRKEPWQREAIHYCFTAIAYDYFRRYVRKSSIMVSNFQPFYIVTFATGPLKYSKRGFTFECLQVT